MPKVVDKIRTRRNPGVTGALAGISILGVVFVLIAFNTPTASAQSPPTGLVIDDVTIVAKLETPNGIAHRASVTVRNSSETDFSGLQRVDYTIDDGELQLAYIVTQLASGQTLTFTFEFPLIPGTRTVNVILGDSELSRTVNVTGADINVEVIEHRLKRGRTVEFVIAITNTGGRFARGLTLSSEWKDNSSENVNESVYDGTLQDLAPVQRTTVVIPYQINPGSYSFTFDVATSSLETNDDNNSTTVSIDVDFVDLRIQLLSAESIGWDSDGNGLMSLNVEVENAGVEDMNSFYVAIDCRGEWSADCSSSVQFARLSAGEKSTSEFRLWLPVGDTPSSVFAVENEDTYRWGNSNVIETTITTPPVPEQAWTLSRTSEPDVASFWSDGSANVELDLTFINNGTDESSTVNIECVQDETVVDSCGGEFVLNLVDDVYPTVIPQSLRLPHGDTTLHFHYGTEEPATLLATVPERIIGVDRDVWDCFSDTSFVDDNAEDDSDGAGAHLKDDLGIGCAGWDETYIKKWPVGKTIKVWVNGEATYVDVFKDLLEDLAPLLNLEFAYVPVVSDAELVAYTGWSKDDASTTDLGCIEFAGCARNSWDDYGNLTRSQIAIWINDIDDDSWRANDIRATTLHELLHSLTGVNHRHHDRTSVMSYESLNYTTIDGMDLGLYELLANPMVEPGMTFDEVAKLIIFNDELNDPPQPVELTAKQILRHAHATWMDAGAVSYEVRGGWPDCNYHFGWGRYEFGNLSPRFPLWQRFEHGSFHYYLVGHPTDRDATEYWLRRGRNWQKVESTKVFDNTYFRSGFTNPFAMLANINIYAEDTSYQVISRNANRVVLEIVINGPNPNWSRNLTLRIRTEIHSETFEISNYKMTWNFNPRERDACDVYNVEGRNPIFGQEFTFPDEIRQGSQILLTDPSTSETARSIPSPLMGEG